MVVRDADRVGFALTELIIVIALISILLGITTIGFNSWQVKHNVEAQVKQMITDFNELRMQSLTRKQRHSITLNANNYVFRSYSSFDENLTAGGTTLPAGTRSVRYGLKSNSTTFFNGTVLEIDDRGLLVSTTASIYLDTTGSATLDCLSVHTARTNPGKKNATWSSCDDR